MRAITPALIPRQQQGGTGFEPTANSRVRVVLRASARLRQLGSDANKSGPGAFESVDKSGPGVVDTYNSGLRIAVAPAGSGILVADKQIMLP